MLNHGVRRGRQKLRKEGDEVLDDFRHGIEPRLPPKGIFVGEARSPSDQHGSGLG